MMRMKNRRNPKPNKEDTTDVADIILVNDKLDLMESKEGTRILACR